jgi:hypothetical protein
MPENRFIYIEEYPKNGCIVKYTWETGAVMKRYVYRLFSRSVISNLFLYSLFFVSFFAFGDNPEVFMQEIHYYTGDTIDVSGNQYISYWGQLPKILTVVNPDGTVSIASSSQRANVLAGGQSGYKSTCMMTIDETGKALSEITELPGIRLNMGDVLRYNAVTGKVYWAVTENTTIYGRNTITLSSEPAHILIYALTPPEAAASDSESD